MCELQNATREKISGGQEIGGAEFLRCPGFYVATGYVGTRSTCTCHIVQYRDPQVVFGVANVHVDAVLL